MCCPYWAGPSPMSFCRLTSSLSLIFLFLKHVTYLKPLLNRSKRYSIFSLNIHVYSSAHFSCSCGHLKLFVRRMARKPRLPSEHNCIVTSLLVICLFSLLFFITDASDTLYANQSLSGDQTIVSLGENFELGFFSPGNSNNYYLGIWFKKVTLPTLQIVWVANRKTPIVDRYSTELKIVNGNLVLHSESTIIWSTNVSSTNLTSPLVAVILENGNFVLRDGGFSDIWQSFDHPTHTWLPDSKIGYNNRTGAKQVLTSWRTSEDPSPGLFSFELDPIQRQCLLKWNGTIQYWTSGYWDGQKFNSIPQTSSNHLYNFSYSSNENESYASYFLNDPSLISRFTLDVSGQVKQSTWLENIQEWNLLWVEPKECDVYALCGAFGTCNVQTGLPVCTCLTGFRPRSTVDWDAGDYSGGCVRIKNLQCGNSNTSEANIDKQGFYMNSQLGLDRASQQVPVQTLLECQSLCSKNCSCIAYAYDSKYFTCHIWTEELLNIRILGDGIIERLPYIKLASSDIPSVKGNGKSPRQKIGIIIASVICGVIVAGCIAYTICRIKTSIQVRKLHQFYNRERPIQDMIDQKESSEDDNNVHFFDFKTILAATNDFSDSNMLGKGGFGPVYKGKLPDGQEVAVKRLSSHSGQGLEEFKNEVVLIAKLQHRNLVKVLGYCTTGVEKIILYEFMLNKSLDNFIFDQRLGKLLDWPTRYEIILGITRGLLYLHQDSRLRVIHRDLKTSNILLDEEMNPKISDFGLARIVGGKNTEANTERVVGTYGYMSPEYAFYGHFSIKSDVFSFGVLLLEIASGRRNSRFYDPEKALSLSVHAWNLWQEEKLLEFMDHTVHATLDFTEALKCVVIGLLCVQEDPFDRPTMTDVVTMLGKDIANIPDPKKPTFVAIPRISCKPVTNSENGLTVSMQEGR